MNANYSEALERQLGMVRWARSAQGKRIATEVFDDSAWFHVACAVLESAPTYYVDGQILSLIDRVASGLPSMRPDLAVLPTSEGFVWLDRGLDLPDLVANDGRLVSRRIRAFTWALCDSRKSGNGPLWNWGGLHDADGLFIVSWAQYAGILGPQCYLEWYRDETQHEAVQREDREAQSSTRHFDAALTTRIYSFLASFWLFVQQRVLIAPSIQVERHARKRIAREGWLRDPVVRVVQLRRKERVGEQPPVQPVQHEWSCQWVVRGHWRQQWYPKRKANNPLWITPYVKGPNDKPLKPPRATVFAVVR